MTKAQQPESIEMVPIDRVTVLNPRVRNRKTFRDIVENIDAIGF